MSWPVVQFGELYTEPSRNGVYKSQEHHGDGVKIVNMGELFAYDVIGSQEMKRLRMSQVEMDSFGLADGDLLFGRRSLVEPGAGKCSIVEGLDQPTTFESSIIRVRLNNTKIRPRFVYYWLKSPQGRGRVKAIVTGTNVKGIRGTVLKTIEIVCPPIPTQDAIILKLRAYDDLIENNRRRIALLEQAARLLYREWFVHLRFPGHEHTPIINGVPEGWERKTLGDVAPLKYGKALKEDDRIPGAFPVYGSSGIVGTHAKAFVPGPTIIVGRKGNVGSVYWSSTDCHPIDTVYYIDSELCSFFLYYALQQMSFISTDVAVPGLNRDFAHSRSILIADQKTFRLFEETVWPIHQQMDLLKRQNTSLSRARDLLLPKLMNGEVAV
jgi:type I restriction enzyme S subunit